MAVELASQLGSLSGVTGFDVTLDIDQESFQMLRSGRQCVFRGYADMLQLD